jgi:hypothetical protein
MLITPLLRQRDNIPDMLETFPTFLVAIVIFDETVSSPMDWLYRLAPIGSKGEICKTILVNPTKANFSFVLLSFMALHHRAMGQADLVMEVTQ